jgi:hypothetical protein
MPNYPNVEQLLCAWLVDVLEVSPTGVHRRVLPEVPSDLVSATGMPCHVVERFGGADVVPGLDVARINIDTFTTGGDPLKARAAALERAEDVRWVIVLRLVGKTLGGPTVGAVVSRVAVMSAPTIRPYDSWNQIRRASAAYEIRIHRPI